MGTETQPTTDYETFVEMAQADGFDLDHPATAVTLAAYVVGPNVKRIATFLGRPRAWCAEPAQRLRENGVWRSGRIAVEGEAPDGVEMAMQCAVAAGFVERAIDG